jgi:hypothetical protein
MICWVMFRMKMVPREMQLRVVLALADVHAKDTLVAAGTGSGKTLPIALCILLDDPKANYFSIAVSPFVADPPLLTQVMQMSLCLVVLVIDFLVYWMGYGCGI